jgi:hypothetical protein
MEPDDRWRRMAWGVLLGALLLAGGCGDDGGGATARQAPVLTVDASHDPERVGDYLRIFFVPASVQVTTLGAPGAVRVFVAGTDYFTPPLALDEVADFVGVPDADALDLVALRCAPDDPAPLDARFATWPALFEVIRADLGGQYPCPPPAGAPPENAVYCIAAAYQDQPSTVAARVLATAFEFGAELLEDPATAAVVRRRYGVYPGYSGLGLAVRGSASNPPLTAADTLRGAVATEYLARNVSLADGGCHCLRVPPYAGRGMDPLDPRFIERAGGVGSCRQASRLRFAS